MDAEKVLIAVLAAALGAAGWVITTLVEEDRRQDEALAALRDRVLVLEVSLSAEQWRERYASPRRRHY